MGFFKNIMSQGLVQDKLKREWAESIYNNIEGIKELTLKYALNLEKETKQLSPEIEEKGAFTSDNPGIRAITDKVLIEQMIEKIFQSAKKEEPRLEAMGFNRWETPTGIVYGAINLIKPTDILEKKLFVSFIAFAVVQLNFGIQFNENGMQQTFKDNGWTDEEIDKVLNYQ